LLVEKLGRYRTISYEFSIAASIKDAFSSNISLGRSIESLDDYEMLLKVGEYAHVSLVSNMDKTYVSISCLSLRKNLHRQLAYQNLFDWIMGRGDVTNIDEKTFSDYRR
jgi:hypothetical protein